MKDGKLLATYEGKIDIIVVTLSIDPPAEVAQAVPVDVPPTPVNTDAPEAVPEENQ